MSLRRPSSARVYRARAAHIALAPSLLLAMALSACGTSAGTSTASADPPPVSDTAPATPGTGTSGFRIGGTVAGLPAGKSLTLVNGSDTVTVTADGIFELPARVAAGGTYSVAVGLAPTGRQCTVLRGTGSGVQGDVGDVAVACTAATYQVAGRVTGLAGGRSVVLQDATAGSVTVTADGGFTLPGRIPYNGSYLVAVATQPSGQTCSVANFGGAGMVADVSDVDVVCSVNAYPVGGSVTGLAAGQSVVLTNNGGDTVTTVGDGTFTFPTPVADGGAYAVAVVSQPPSRTCSVTQGSGTVSGTPAYGAVVTCATVDYPVSGRVTGLPSGAQVTLTNNGSDAVVVAGNGSFTFPTPVAGGADALVQVGTQPTTAECRVTNGQRTALSAAVTDVTVTCKRPLLFGAVALAGMYFLNAWYTQPDGTLTLVGQVPTSALPTAMVYSPVSDRLYTVNGASGYVSTYIVNQDGYLSYYTTIGNGLGFRHVSLDTSGRYLLASDGTANQLVVIDTSDHSTIATRSTGAMTPAQAVFSWNREYVSVLNSDRSMSVYRIFGQPLMLPYTSAARTNTIMTSSTRFSLTAHPSQQAVVIGRDSAGGIGSQVFWYDLSDTLAPTTRSLTDALAGLAVDESGQTLLTLGGTTIGFLPLGSDGSIGTATTTSVFVTAQTTPVLEPTGRFLYYGAANAVRRFNRSSQQTADALSATGSVRLLEVRRW